MTSVTRELNPNSIKCMKTIQSKSTTELLEVKINRTMHRAICLFREKKDDGKVLI